MTVGDTLHYLTLGNPLSKTVIGTTGSLLTKLVPLKGQSTASMSRAVVANALPPLWKLAGHNYYFVRLAGLSGATAVILGAIGSHHLNIEEKAELRNIFDTANRFHFFHSIALFAMPLAKYPLMSGTLMAVGTALFSGTLYYRAFSGKKPTFSKLAPMGGTCLILAWLSLLV